MRSLSRSGTGSGKSDSNHGTLDSDGKNRERSEFLRARRASSSEGILDSGAFEGVFCVLEFTMAFSLSKLTKDVVCAMMRGDSAVALRHINEHLSD